MYSLWAFWSALEQKVPGALIPAWPCSHLLSSYQCPVIWHQRWKGASIGLSGNKAVFKMSLVQLFLREAQSANRPTLIRGVSYHGHLIYLATALSCLVDEGHNATQSDPKCMCGSSCCLGQLQEGAVLCLPSEVPFFFFLIIGYIYGIQCDLFFVF